jgi:E3 ubiquitin-protein ligase UBR7
VNSKTGQKGDVTGEEPAQSNKYNQNFRNRFCGCGEDYDPNQEKGTMFQCLGLGTVENGGCGEDWWHPECLVGYTREEYAKMIEKPKAEEAKAGAEMTGVSTAKAEGDTSAINTEMTDAPSEKPMVDVSAVHEEIDGQRDIGRATITGRIDAAIANGTGIDGNDVAAEVEEEEDDPPLPPGFPAEEDFDHFICYKCLEANSWIKKYAGSDGFLPPVYMDKALNSTRTTDVTMGPPQPASGETKKRKASDDDSEEPTSSNLAPPIPAKRQKSEDPSGPLSSIPEDTTTLPLTPKKQENTSICKYTDLPPLPSPGHTTTFSLFLKPDFRDHLCRCTSCFPHLKAHPQLLEEEDTYEPPMSSSGDGGAQSVGTGSILDRGEAAFNAMDRVQALQGAMAYAHLKDKISTFLKPFAESGQAVGAEDIKTYFEKLRGDAKGIQEAAGGAKANREGDDEGRDGEGGGRREQSGY